MHKGSVATSTDSEAKQICWVREDTARKINATLDRLALVIEVLQETRCGDVIPGTRGLRQGAEAGLQEMLSHLSRLPREPVMTENYLLGPEEEHAMTWISGNIVNQSLPPGTIAFISQVIRRLLP